jgi:hypothetical protein
LKGTARPDDLPGMNARSLLAIFALASAALSANAGPVKVFILAGQSNMEGKAKVSLLDYQVKQPATRPRFAHFEKDGKWAEREDVWIKFLDRKGPLTVGYGSPGCIGPELQFGWTMGDRFAEPVLLIKTAWGGRSLWRDFRPPSAGLPPDTDPALQKLLTNAQKKKPEATLDEVKQPFGAAYRDMLAEVRAVLADPAAQFPALKGNTPELAGFVWFQGWNDMIDATYTAEYATNLAHFIRDVRRDLKAPALPVVVVEMGVDGPKPGENIQRFKAAQTEGAGLAEFKGNVALVKSDALWDMEADAVFRKGWKENRAEWDTVGSDFPYHYLGSPKILCAIGQASAEALLNLRGK